MSAIKKLAEYEIKRAKKMKKAKKRIKGAKKELSKEEIILKAFKEHAGEA
jgi:hypothetical protein